MKRINRTLRLLAVSAVALGTLLSTAPAQAITVYINPATQTIGTGGTASIDIIVSDLTAAVGAFSLTLDFNDTFLTAGTFLNDPDGAMGAGAFDLSGGFSGGSLDLYYLADATLDEAGLSALQGSTFTLARVTFQGAAHGLSPLTLSSVNLSMSDGVTTLPGVESVNGEICVGEGGCERAVPEPGTLALLSLGMLGMGLARRRRGA